MAPPRVSHYVEPVLKSQPAAAHRAHRAAGIAVLLVAPFLVAAVCFSSLAATNQPHQQRPAAPRRQQPFTTRQSSSRSSNSTSSRATSPPALPHMLTPSDCPGWLADYAAFHRQQRGQSSARYLVYSACPGSSGLGDRVRGMMYLTRLAAASQRVVLFTWRNEPHELEQYLPPAGPINWTLDGIQGYSYPRLSSFCGDAPATDPKTLTCNSTTSSSCHSSNHTSSDSQIALRVTDYKSADGAVRGFLRKGGLQQLQHYRFVTIHTNEWFTVPCTGCPSVAEPSPTAAGLWPAAAAAGVAAGQPEVSDSSEGMDRSASCLFRYLFGLSDAVQQAAQAQLEALFGKQARRPGFLFLAVHLRLGGMEHEKKLKGSKGSDNGPLLDLVRGIGCIRQLGASVGIDTRKVPILLFTDHLELRAFVQQGRLVDVVSSAVTPTHLARMKKDEAADPQAAMSTYVDVALLARARCAVYSRSGFSTTAWMMGGGTDCFAHFQSDLEQCVAANASSSLKGKARTSQ